MQLMLVLAGLLASTVSARSFTLYDEINFGGNGHGESRNDDSACWNLNGAGDRASSVRGDGGCTTFYRERECSGPSWQQRGDAFTVPDFIQDHIFAFRNQC